jgi:condensation domain-containing protein
VTGIKDVDLQQEVIRTGPLQSGICQLEWVHYRHRGRGIFVNFERIIPVPHGVPDEAVLAAIGDLLSRHEVLRTIFDTDSFGQPRQRVREVHPPSLTAVEEIDFAHEFVTAPLDVEARGPIRFGRLPDGSLIFVVAHMAADFTATEILVEELTELLVARAERRAPRLGALPAQPIDQALRERDGRGRTRAESALRHWADALPSHPLTVFPIRRCAPNAEVVHAELRSAAACAALRRLQSRYLTSPASVFVTAAYTALAIVFDRERVALNLTWSGREQPRTRGMVASLFRNMPLLIDFGDRPSFADTLMQTRDAILKASRHMSFDVLEFHEQAAQVEAARGVFSPRSESINCILSGLSAEPVDAIPDPQVTLVDSELDIWQSNDPVRDTCSLYVTAVAAGEDLAIAVAVDESYLGTQECAALVRLIERILVEAAATDNLTFAAAEAFAGGRRILDPARWQRVDDLWVDVHFLASVLDEHPAVQAAAVCLEEGTLVAYVTGDVQPWELRDHLLSRDNGRGPVMSPHRFVVTTMDGSAVTETLPQRAPERSAERALASAVATANGLAAPSTANSYLTAGGRLYQVPRVLSLLVQAGYDGLTPADLRRPASLRALAGRLKPVS